ncbi:Hypothetical protein, putative, partial [Bodo saltans]
SAVCNLLVLGLSVVKMLLDAWDLWSAVRRRIDALCRVNSAKMTELTCEGMVNQDESFVSVTNMCDHEDFVRDLGSSNSVRRVESESPLFTPVNFFDSMFWDDGGRAIGTSSAEELNEIVTTHVRLGRQ